MFEWLSEWLLGKGVGLAWSLFLSALIYPVYKAGFFIRQGLTDYQEYGEVTKELQERGMSWSDASGEALVQYRRVTRRMVLMLTAAPLFLIAVASSLLIFTTWKFAGLSLLVAVYGNINLKD